MKEGAKDGKAEPPRPRDVPELELELSGSLVRCPFCRGDVDVGDPTKWTACAGCLARHHVACWTEAGRCASCRAPNRLVVLSTNKVVAPPARSAAPFLLVLALVLLGLLTAFTAQQHQQAAARADELTKERDAARSEAADAVAKGFTQHRIALPDGVSLGLSGDRWWVTRRDGEKILGSVMGAEMPLVGIDRDGVDVSNTGGPSRIPFAPGAMTVVDETGAIKTVPELPLHGR